MIIGWFSNDMDLIQLNTLDDRVLGLIAWVATNPVAIYVKFIDKKAI